MKNWKKLMALMLALSMCMSLMTTTAFAAEETLNEAPKATVEIPLTSVDDPATEEKENQNTVEGDSVGTTTVTGDVPTSPEDKEYNYIETTVIEQGSATVTTKEITITENVDKEMSDLDYVESETAPDGKNDLIIDNSSWGYEDGDNNPETAPTLKEIPEREGDEDYEFVYVGTGNTSQFFPGVVFTEPLTDEQKVEQYGDDYKNGAYIVKDYHRDYFLNQLDEEYRNTIAKDENGNYVYNDQGYLLDKDGNRVLKKEQTMVGPDGKTYYLHRFDNNGAGNYVEGWYMDGEWMKGLNDPAQLDDTENPIPLAAVPKLDKDGKLVLDENGNPVLVNITYTYKNGKKYIKDEDGNILTSYSAVWAGAQQFVLVDSTTGEVVTTYCADLVTRTQDVYRYNIENLEDADYYTEEQAAMIRTIAKNGYWGNSDNPTTTELEPGSLAAVKDMMRNAYEENEDGTVKKDENGDPIRIFSDAEIDSLTDGVALTATQCAIWSCSNKMDGVEFINTNYVGKVGDTVAGTMGNVPGEKGDEALLLFKLYDYMLSMEPTEIENPTTADTIINADNYIENLSVTVLDRARNHVNNQDSDGTNDAYVTKVSFALVVTPGNADGEDPNGDDLIVKMIDANGDVMAIGRIAGADGDEVNHEKYQELVKEGENYSFNNIVMVEGEQNFNITLEGVQNLEEGVYLYTSEVRTDDAGDEISSQTMVGVAHGKRNVDISMNLKFDLTVEDEVVVKERVWKSETSVEEEPPVEIPDEEPPLEPVPPEEEPPVEIPDDEPPLVDIPEEEPPLTDIPEEEPPVVDIPDKEIALEDVPKTGDVSLLALGLTSLLSGGGLVGLVGMGRKGRKDA